MRLSRIFLALALLAAAGAGLFYLLTMPRPAVTGPLPARSADLGNGETMFNAGGCASCHATPKQEDQKRLGGGLALATPFGTFMVPNISSDAKHGIGAWTEEEFANAMPPDYDLIRFAGRRGTDSKHDRIGRAPKDALCHTFRPVKVEHPRLNRLQRLSRRGTVR